MAKLTDFDASVALPPGLEVAALRRAIDYMEKELAGLVEIYFEQANVFSAIVGIFGAKALDAVSNYGVFWGETKEKRAFEDRHASTAAYIDYMRPRYVELARVLKRTGSFYYHCDWPVRRHSCQYAQGIPNEGSLPCSTT